MPDTYQPSDEQIEALCAADFAADPDNVQWDECVIKDAWRDDMRALTRSPAFQSIIRAAQAEALRKAAADVRADWFPDSCGWVGYLDDRADEIESADV